MRIAALFLFASMAALGLAQAPVCANVEGDRILGRDLAAAIPEFKAMPPDTLLGTSPVPGSRRLFHAAEILSLARRYSVPLGAGREICFEWPMAPLVPARLIEAMRASLQAPGAEIRIAESSPEPVPPGRLDFPRDHLAIPSPGQRSPVLWRGDVVYGDTRRFAIWVRVDIAVPCDRLTAAENLASGQPIKPAQLRAVASTCFPAPGGTVLSLDSATGMVPSRWIAAGTEVRPESLAAANDVNRGDMVEIEVLSGAARLAFTGQAVSSGRIGDTIAVRNPDSKKIFQARISGKNKAIVQASGPKGS